MNNYKLYIDGQWVDSQSGETFEIQNPSNGQIIATAAYGDERDAELAVAAADRAFKEWSTTPAPERAQIMRRIYDLMQENLEELARLVTLEMGKPIKEARTEVQLAAEYVLWNAEEARRAMGYTIPSSSRSKRLQTISVPVGPVAAITPWNFPIAMVTRKISPAIAAGCTIVFKPASQTPGSTILWFQLAEKAGLPKGVINLVMGSASKIGQVLLTDPRIRKVTFTGSTETGKKILAQAASTCKRVSLELGGHAPLIVFEDADLEKAAEGAVASKYRNNGQTCVCTNRIYVHESVKDQFVALFKEKVEQLRIGEGLTEDIDLGPLVDKAAFEKVDFQVNDAVSKGATIVTGGERFINTQVDGGFYYKPTILDNVNEQMDITYEETFGPIAPIYTFKTEEEAINKANDTVYGLTAFFYTNDISRSHRVSEALDFGMVGINDAVISTVQAPFGGIKESGMGREGGPNGLADFLETKYISTGI